jgi:hypothetical protein
MEMGKRCNLDTEEPRVYTETPHRSMGFPIRGNKLSTIFYVFHVSTPAQEDVLVVALRDPYLLDVRL